MNHTSRRSLRNPTPRVGHKVLLIIVPVLTLLALIPAKSASATSSLARLTSDFTPMPAGVSLKGSAPSNETMRVSLTLKANPGLQSYAREVNTPGNPNYHRYLTHQEVGQKFGQSLSTIDSIRSYFAAKGLSATAGVGRMRIELTGPVSAIENAFNTSIQTASIPGIGVRPEATNVPSLPQSFANDIQSIVGLSDYVKFAPCLLSASKVSPVATGASPATAAAAAAIYSASTCSSARLGISMGNLTPNSPSVLGYDYQMDPFYASGESGQGQTVAFLEFATYNPSDITNFEGCFGSSANSTGSGANLLNPVLVDGGALSTDSGHSEVTGDLETVASLAPNSNLEVYSAPNGSTGFLDAVSQWITQDNAAIMSSSWGVCEVGKGSISGLAQSLNTEFATAAVQGQTFISASGDTGSQCSGSLSTSVPADSPNVLAVGGTTLPGYSKSTETTWNNPYGASGGGVSTLFQLPSYQSALGTLNSPTSTDYSSNCPTASYPSGCRMVPDVSASADPVHGYYAYCTICSSISNWSEIGGTSISTPLWAAGLSLVNQACYSAKGNLGLANSALYPMAGTAAFNDITTGNNDVSSSTGYSTPYYSAATGYDMVTGLGTPNFATIAEKYCNLTFSPTLALTDTSSTFPQTSPGVPETEAFALVNVGFSNIAEPDPSAMTISGTDSTQFSISSTSTTCSSANTLAPGGTCTIGVSYSPTYYGTAEATLNVASTSSNSPTISLVGDTPTTTLTHSNSISLTAYIGSQGPSSSVTLTNNASYPVQLGNPSYLITGANLPAFSVGSSSTCSGTISLNASCTLDIVYNAQASPTSDSAQLNLIDGLGNSYATLSLAGTT
ncbi:MAG: choice-of-anchor D domain-containing protein, partial [Acidimicrobiaceae bacterium]|nr:choice-of-anchor D domain-containing protein [Acidimicrobiaceae bacterium]